MVQRASLGCKLQWDVAAAGLEHPGEGTQPLHPAQPGLAHRVPLPGILPPGSPPLSLRNSDILQVCFSPFASTPINPGSVSYRPVLIFSLTCSLTNPTQVKEYLLQNFPQTVLGPGRFCFPADCQGCTIGIFARQGIQKAVKLHRHRLLLELLQVFVN